MTVSAPLEAHPAALAFPMMDDAKLAALAADIKAHGQNEPIVIFDGLLLDGRNRFAACGIAGVSPKLRTLSDCDSPTAFVLSANQHRRHMTPVQLAALAQSPAILDGFRAEAKARMAAGGGDKSGLYVSSTTRSATTSNPRISRAVAQAADAVGAGRDATYSMGKVLAASPEVYARALAGEFKTVAEAKRAAGVEEPRDKVKPTKSPVAPPPSSPQVTRPTKQSPEDIEFDAKVVKLTKEGHPASDIARQLGVPSNQVHYAKRRLGLLQVSPLQGPLDFATESTESFQMMTSAFKTQWSTASDEQRLDLTTRLQELVRAVRTFSQRLNKEANQE